MSMQMTSNNDKQSKINNPMFILHRQIKDKTLKKSALESITTISIALGRKKTRQQLIPYLASIFVDQNIEIQKIILKGLTQLLHPIYIGKPHHSRLILELIMDILCVYPNKQIRQEAYICLEKVFSFMDVRKAQNVLVEALKRLNNESEDANIRQLVLRMIPYVYAGVDGDNEKQLLEILNSFKSKLSDQKLLSQVLTQFIKVMPPAPESEIRQIITILIKTQDKEILSNLIQPVILLTKVTDEDSTVGYLKSILEQPDPAVLCIALKKYIGLSSVFKEENLEVIANTIKNYDTQPQQIKNIILEILDTLPISEENMIKLCEPPNSLQLKTTLSETLCKVSDNKGLLKLFHSGDPNFQVKLFPKLPPISSMHIEIVDKILNSKSWRQKLTIMQNIQLRTEKQQETQILLPKLSQFLGDKIACVRISVSDGIRSIMIKRKISLQSMMPILNKNLEAKNWFERQAVYRIILDIIIVSKSHKKQRSQIEKVYRKGLQQKIVNIKEIASEIEKHMGQQD